MFIKQQWKIIIIYKPPDMSLRNMHSETSLQGKWNTFSFLKSRIFLHKNKNY